jgi:hypothetical protein
MAESGIFRGAALQPWQRETLLAAALFMREQYGNPPADPKAKAVYDGLLEVMDPARRTVRMQREQAAAARAVAAERRTGRDRRALPDRRGATLGPPGGVERRKAHRRSGERRARR